MARAPKRGQGKEQGLVDAIKAIDAGTASDLLRESGFVVAIKPLEPGDTGEIIKTFSEIAFQKGCWDKEADVHGCTIYKATCDTSQVDVYKQSNLVFPVPQSHQYKKGGAVKVCGTTVTLPEAKRIV